jgi:hypothetical protein
MYPALSEPIAKGKAQQLAAQSPPSHLRDYASYNQDRSMENSRQIAQSLPNAAQGFSKPGSGQRRLNYGSVDS